MTCVFRKEGVGGEGGEGVVAGVKAGEPYAKSIQSEFNKT